MSRAEALNPGNDVIHAVLGSSIPQHLSDSSELKDQTSLWQQELETARPGSDFSRQGPDVSGGAGGRRLHNNKRSFVTGPLWVLKATPCLPLPPSFLPHPFCCTLFTPPKPILGHLMNPRCLGEATEVVVYSRRCFTPLPWQCPQAFTSQGSGGRKGEGKKEDNKLVKEPGTQYCDYSWSGEWGRGSHPVLERRSDGWRERWDGFRFPWFGMVLGKGSRQCAWS